MAVEDLRILERQDADGLGWMLLGALAYDTVPLARQALGERSLPSGGQVVIDLAGLTLCDSAGIAFLLTLRRRAQEAGAVLVLAAVPDFLTRQMTLLGLDAIFTLQTP